MSELVGLHWTQVDLKAALLHVARLKHGTPAVHPLTGRELRALRRLQRAAADARLPEGVPINPHALRHAGGFTLANKGTDTRTIQAYLGHRSIQHTVRYTELAPGRFNGLFRD